MGWCSGTYVFDGVMDAFINEKSISKAVKKKIIKKVIEALQERDWDCESDSDYWEHPLVREIFMELKPEWFEDED